MTTTIDSLDARLADVFPPVMTPVIVVDNQAHFAMYFDSEGRNLPFRPTLNVQHAHMCFDVLLNRFQALKVSLAMAGTSSDWAALIRGEGIQQAHGKGKTAAMALSMAMADFIIKNKVTKL